jgi:hypothetical protein
MTRYQIVASTLSTWLAKARAPTGDDAARGERAPISSQTPQAIHSAARRPRRFTLPQSAQRPDAPLDGPSLLVRLWRARGR